MQTVDLPVWFPAWSIVPTTTQLEYFLLEELGNLRFGDYPTEPDEYKTFRRNGWIDMKRSVYEKAGKRPTNHNAPFLVGIEIAAEIDARIAMIPTPQQHWIDEHYLGGLDFEEIAKFYHFKESQVKREISRMIRYISGKNRAELDYETFIRERRKYKEKAPVP